MDPETFAHLSKALLPEMAMEIDKCLTEGYRREWQAKVLTALSYTKRYGPAHIYIKDPRGHAEFGLFPIVFCRSCGNGLNRRIYNHKYQFSAESFGGEKCGRIFGNQKNNFCREIRPADYEVTNFSNELTGL
nr:hypothetical protein K-LCC10_0230 [Kaumoebavirus]